MKKILYFIIGIIPLLVSCADGHDDATVDIYKDIDKLKNDIDLQSKGIFKMVWIVDKQVVDTAEFICGSDYATIEYLPAEYLVKQLIPDIKREDLSFLGASEWPLIIKWNGYSEDWHNAYYMNNKKWIECKLKIKQEEYIITFRIGDNYLSSLVYDVLKDTWSGTVPLDYLFIESTSTNEFIEKRYDPALNLSFQTIKRIR